MTRLGVTGTLARTLGTTNPTESTIDIGPDNTLRLTARNDTGPTARTRRPTKTDP